MAEAYDAEEPNFDDVEVVESVEKSVEVNGNSGKSVKQARAKKEVFLSVAFNEVKLPLAQFFVLWTILSIIFSIAGHYDINALGFALLLGSLCSICGTSLILFSGWMARDFHRHNFQFIYYISVCDLLFALMLFIDALVWVAGFTLEWKDANSGYCYFIAIFGQIVAMGSMGYTFVVMLDLLFIVFRPMSYARVKHTYIPWYHAGVWIAAIGSCIPAIGVGAVGMNQNQTCWLLGDYVWFFWSFWYAFVGFALVGVVALVLKLNAQSRQTDMISMAFVKVIKQSILIIYTFFLAWIWNIILELCVLFNAPIPLWLVSVQLFWLGGIGFSNAIIWTPFIKKAIARAASFSGRHRRVHVSSNSNTTGDNSATVSHSPKDEGETSFSPSTRTQMVIVASKSGGVPLETGTTEV